jgi:hypothetical protein
VDTYKHPGRVKEIDDSAWTMVKKGDEIVEREGVFPLCQLSFQISVTDSDV